MKKNLLILAAAALALPLSVLAADGAKRGDREEGAKAPAAAASASAEGHTAHKPHDPVAVAQHRDAQIKEMRSAKDRGSRMSACRKEAQDQGMGDAEQKQAIADCLKRGQ
jgi:hypothetical protein